MAELYDTFPDLKNEKISIRKMAERDAEALFEISNNAAVYRYISPFLYKKSVNFLRTAIGHFGARDFDKKKMIIAGIYLQRAPDKLVGLAEMFDYKKRANTITIGCRINETYWHQGIATSAIQLMVQYLLGEMGVGCIRAYVMPENVHSAKALLKNGFVKETHVVQEKNWGGHDVVDVEVYTCRQNHV